MSYGKVDRRSFIRATGTLAGSSLLWWSGARELAAARPGAVTRYPLRMPPILSPTGITLTAAPSVEDLGGGSNSTAWTYNSEFPGPTLVVNQGDTATIDLVNGLQEETITHWHGMLVDHANDGHPALAIPPGNTYRYTFPILNRAALNWYHPHPHMLTGKQVNLGLAGAFIVRDAEEAVLNLPSGPYEIPLIIRDATRDKSGNLQYRASHGGFDGKIPLVNGTRSPYLEVARAIYRFRVLNGANARIFRLVLGNGATFTLIGNDGGLLPLKPVSLSQIDIAPGERVDILVDFRAASGTIMLRDLRAGWDLLEFRPFGAVVDGSLPAELPAVTPLSNPVRTRAFSFDAMSRINGLEYDVSRIDFYVPFGETELWRFTTNGNAPHPVHVHGASFQVVSRSGGRGALFPWEAGWKDTVLLEDGETVEVLVRFDAYRGLYVMHCHKLEHEDMGMMSNFEVV